MMSQRILNRKLAGFLAAWTLWLGICPGKAAAMPTDSITISASAPSLREAQTEEILKSLTGPRARAHLLAAGVTPQELREQLARLDDEELANVAQRTEAVKAGGVLGLIIGLVVLTILIVILIYLLDDDDIDLD